MRFFRISVLIAMLLTLISCGSDSANTAATDEDSISAVQVFEEDGLSHTLGTLEADGDGIPIATAELNQQEPETIYLAGQGIWLVVWEDERDTETTGSDVYARFMRDNGTYCGNEILISNASGQQTSPKVAYDNTRNNALITWQDSRGTGAQGYVYYNTLTLGATFKTSCDTAADVTLGTEKPFGFTPTEAGDSLILREKPVLKYNSAKDQFIFAWVEKRTVPHYVLHSCFGAAFFEQTVNLNSYLGYSYVNAATAATEPLPVNGSNIMRSTEITPTGGYTTFRIEGWTFGTDPEHLDLVEYADIQNPGIACDTSTGECVVAFEARKNIYKLQCNNPDDITVLWTEEELDENKNIYSVLDSTFQTASDETLISAKIAETNNYYPATGYDPVTHRYLIAWERSPIDENSKIMGQLLYSTGGAYGNNFQIGSSYDTDNKQTNPFITYDSVNQRFLTAWEDARTGASSLENIDVYGQFVNGAGDLSGENFPFVTSSYNQQSPSAAFNISNNQYLAVWKDARKADIDNCGSGTQPCGADIYGIRFTIGQPQITIWDSSDQVLNPSLINFGTNNTNTTSQASFKIHNSGDDVLRVDCFTALTAPFSYVSLPTEISACEEGDYLEVLPGTEQSFNVNFAPTVNGTFSGSITIQSNAGYRTINLTGTAQNASIEVPNADNSTIDFGTITVNETSQKTFTLRNNGQVSYNIESISGITAPFSFTGTPFYPIALTSGEEQQFSVTFAPTAAGSFSKTLTVTTDTNVTTTIILKGSATEDTGAGPVMALYDGDSGTALGTSPVLDFGTIPSGGDVRKTLQIRNSGDENLELDCITGVENGFEFLNLTPKLASCDGVFTTIVPGVAVDYTISFSGEGNDTHTNSFTIESNAGTVSVNASCTTVNVENALSVETSTIDFGEVNIGEDPALESTIIKNSSSVDIDILEIDSPVSGLTIEVSSMTIPANGSITANFSFAPSKTDSVDEVVTFVTSSDARVAVRVMGKGEETSSGGTDDEGDNGEPQGGCSAGGSANWALALLAFGSLAKVMIRRKEDN
jgi:hypothetical protein